MARLLVVDDEVDVREFVANFFRRRSVEVTTASRGKEALEIIEKQRPDLVLLDIRMPEMDGIEILTEIRKRDEKIKVIMVTGRDPEEERACERCRELGALDYIHKPLELDALEKKVLQELTRT